MESPTTKTTTNVLLVIAILLLSASVFVSLRNNTERATPLTPLPPTTTPTQNPVSIPVTPEVIEASISTTTPTATTSPTTTTVSITGFTNKAWTWTKTIGASTSTSPKKANAFTITFKADGTLNGTTDCNSFFGSYSVASNTLSFGPLGSTRMYCEDSQEGDFMAALQEVKNFTLGKTNDLTLITGSSSLLFK